MSTIAISLPRAARREGRSSSPVLTRQLLKQGSIDALAAIDSPNLKLWTEADRVASLRESRGANDNNGSQAPVHTT